jgi:O-antigen/teichoic acid export membrane protein
MVTGLLAFINVSYSAPLLSWKYENKIFWAMGAGGIVNITLNIILIPHYGAVGAAIAAISTEFAVLIGLSIIIYSAIQKLYLFSLLKVLLYALLSCIVGYYLMYIGLYAIIAGCISILLFALINFVFKTVTVEEVKMYLKKN